MAGVPVGDIIDIKETEAQIIARASIGLQRAGEFALGRAKQHAPVRELFGTGRRPVERVGRDWKTMRSAKRYKAFIQQKMNEKRMNISRVDSLTVDKMRANQAGGIIREGRMMGATGSFRGHQKSLFPVFQTGKGKVTGDFRQLSNFERTGKSLQKHGYNPSEVVVQRKGRNRSSLASGTTPGGKNRVSTAMGGSSALNRLSAQGRYEVKQALVASAQKRRGISPTVKSALFQGRVGGRLRGEIRMRPLTWRQGVAWVYIESPTDYARHQEFGTKRHRAQPFLRPALYESRTVLRSEVRRAVGTEDWVVKFRDTPTAKNQGASSQRFPWDASGDYPTSPVLQPPEQAPDMPSMPSGPGVVPGEAYPSGGF